MGALCTAKCEPCQGGVPPMTWDEAEELQKQLHRDWRLQPQDGEYNLARDTYDHPQRLIRTFKTADFAGSLDLADRFGRISEQCGHHPILVVNWGSLAAIIYTHKIDALAKADFVLAAKFDQEYRD